MYIRKLKITTLGVTAALLLCGFLSAAHATTYYVATNGNDSNSGTSTQPYRTIGKGVTRLAPGDTLIISGGTYVEPSINNKIPSGSSWAAPVTVMASPGEIVVLRPTTKGMPGINIRAGRKFIRLVGIGIDLQLVADTNGVKVHEKASDIELSNLDIRNGHGMLGSAIVVIAGSPRVTIRGSKLHDISQYPVDKPGNHGIYMQGTFGLIEGNEIYNIQGYGIQLYSSIGNVNDNIVRYNTIRKTGQPTINTEGGIYAASGNRNKVYGNLVYNSYGAGVVLKGDNNQFYNNTIYKSHSYGIQVTGNNHVIKNNIVFGNSSNVSDRSSGTILANNLVTDPSFVDASNGNFRLKSGSPAIDKGLDIAEVTLDLDGVARPQGASVDIGAYEYKLTTVTASPPTSPSSLQAVPQ